MEGDSDVLTEQMQVIKLADISDSNNYKLNLNYKDPFLKDSDIRKKAIRETGNAKEKKAKIQVPKMPEPVKTINDIKYSGLVKNNSSGISTALVSINGKGHLVRKGDIIDGIVIKNISNDHVEIKDGKNIITISK